MERLEQLKWHLDTLCQLDATMAVFGAHTHRYRLKPRLTADELKAFEQRCHVVLPDAYRAFLLNVGNGGAGPNHGIFSLAQSLDEICSLADAPLPPDFLATPFPAPHTLEQAEALPYPAPGMLPLGHIGSGAMTILVIAGNERGHIWHWFDAYTPYPPPTNRPQYTNTDAQEDLRRWEQWATALLAPQNTYRIDFLRWYELWLETEIQRCSNRSP